MKFRTEIIQDKSDMLIQHDQPVITIGSCFADNIAAKLNYYRFKLLSNPFGVLYNPASIYNSLKLVNESETFPEEELFEFNGRWHSFYHHSVFSGIDRKKVLDNINSKLNETREFLKTCRFIIITLGSSYYFKHKNSGQIVSNCHKMPAREFSMEKLSVEEIFNYCDLITQIVSGLNPGCSFIFSVSPIRYLKFGFTGNQQSKAALILGLEKLLQKNKQCAYFPAYEIMIDDLRDYRFYDTGLVQPNQQAVDYIWEKFCENYLSEECKKAMYDIEKLNKAREHRPFNPDTEEYQSFVKTQVDYILNLETRYPYLDLEKDKEFFMTQKK
ncbi:MAG: GSCFA domain-containing protein [Calditrichaceae bacterium]|nr:GSCFA domain-containing protein [Calditrichaceae bacterium]